jgi:hypothetical protein
MLRKRIIGIGIILAVILHLDWHLARPHHEHLGFSFNVGFAWPYHWIATAVIFAIVALFISRRWPNDRLVIAAGAFAIGVFGAQVIWPIAESIVFMGRLGFATEPGRWAAFGQTIATATPAYAGVLWCGAGRSGNRDQ